MRQRASRVVNTRFPRLSWDIWSARRSIEQAGSVGYAAAVRNQWDRRTNAAVRPLAAEARLLLVVPMADHVEIPWEPAQGNYSFELFETASAYLGADRVETLRIAKDEPTDAYHQRIVDYLNHGAFTHVISRIDIEANGGEHWSWDSFVHRLRRQWPGVFLPLSYDSAYPYVSMHLDRITRMHHRTMPIVLDRPITEVVRPHRPAAGPLFLPLSDASTEALLGALGDTKPDIDLSFIGNVAGYPYRADLLHALEAEGLEVTVNPQGRSADSMPGFASYAMALRRSRITLNFTRCNGVPVTQLKTRMLEGSLFGSVVAADSPLYARDYFAQGEEFISYDSPAHLKSQVVELLGDEARLEAMRQRAFAKANRLRVRNFWEATDRALSERQFPTLLVSA